MKNLFLFLALLVATVSEGQQLTSSRRIKPAGPAAAETDPTVPAAAKALTPTDVSNWNTAYGWGNHASAGYLTSASAASTYVTLGTAQTITGDKTFTGAFSIPATSIAGNLTPATNNNRDLGSTSFKWLNIYSTSFLGTTNVFYGTNSTTNAIYFRTGTGTSYPFGIQGTTGNSFFQNTGAAAPSDNLAGASFLYAKTAASAVARGVYIATPLTAAANNDALVSLDIAPTFTNGAFTGVGNYAIRSSGMIVPATDNAITFGTSALRYSTVFSPILQAGTTLKLRSAASSSIQLQLGSDATTVMGVEGATGRTYVQPAGSPASGLAAQLNVTGTTNVTDNIEVTTNDKGIILRSANGTRYLITVSNAGAVTVSAAP